MCCYIQTVQLRVLEQPASRHLISALTLFAGTYPRPLMVCVIVPVVTDESCRAVQADVVMKLVKTVFNSDHYSELLRSVCFHSGLYRVAQKSEISFRFLHLLRRLNFA